MIKTDLLPPFDEAGNLPPGIYEATWDEIQSRFGGNEQRRGLLHGLRMGLDALAAAGCEIVFLNGSFVTTKETPGDFDACWVPNDAMDIDLLPAAFFDFRVGSPLQKAAFGGEFFVADSIAESFFHAPPIVYLDFFQRGRDQSRKGIVRINLTDWKNNND